VQVSYRSFLVAFELAKDRQGTQVGYPFALLNLCALGEGMELFAGASLVSFSKQRFNLMIEVENIRHIEGPGLGPEGGEDPRIGRR
jgi:hypothetical protein